MRPSTANVPGRASREAALSSFVFEEIRSQGELVTASLTPADRAAEIVAEAHARAVEIKREAHEAGYEAGRAEVIAQAEA